MSDFNSSPSFPEGSTVRDRLTGREYTANGTAARQGDQPHYWTIVHSPDGIDRQLPTDDLEPVDAAEPATALRAAVTAAGQFFPGRPVAPLRVLVHVLTRTEAAA